MRDGCKQTVAHRLGLSSDGGHLSKLGQRRALERERQLDRESFQKMRLLGKKYPARIGGQNCEDTELTARDSEAWLRKNWKPSRKK